MVLTAEPINLDVQAGQATSTWGAAIQAASGMVFTNELRQPAVARLVRSHPAVTATATAESWELT